MSVEYRVSCDCGFTGSYHSRPIADWALQRHSCTRWRERAAAHARGLARAARIDRTPKPCRHKKANHQHGSYAAYNLDRCRCYPCATAASNNARRRGRLQAYGRYDRYVDADQARDHVQQLMAQGMGLKRIVTVSGVAQGTLWKLIYGKRRPDGSRTPSRRILRTTHERLINTEVDLAAGTVDADATTRARLQIQSLVAIGWSMSKLGQKLGVSPVNMPRMVHGDTLFQQRTIRKITWLYERLWDQPPPEQNQRERIAATRARRYANERGWLKPIEVDLVDEPAPATVIDEVAVERMLGGRRADLSLAEKLEVVRRWQASDRSLHQLELLTGWNVHRYLRQLKEAV